LINVFFVIGLIIAVSGITITSIVRPISDLAVRRRLRRMFKGETVYGKILEIIGNLGNYIGLIMYLASYSYEVSK